MIAGQFHQGSGLGNQLFRYVMTRTLALDKGYEWGMIDTHLFKGSLFMNLDMGKPVDIKSMQYKYNERRIDNAVGVDIRTYDWEGILRIKDNTIIDGEFQGEKYWEHYYKEINQWLKVEPYNPGTEICIIAFRGGEYTYFPDLFLTQEYWDEAMRIMKKEFPSVQFRVVTDDVNTARLFFPHIEITHDIEYDWKSIRYAYHLILSNSSFGILPAWLNENVKMIIAPKFWARRNRGYWALPYNEYKSWKYI